MTRRNHNTTPSPDTEPKTPELSADMSREDLKAYYDTQAERAAAISSALNGDADDWHQENSFLQSGKVLHELMGQISNDPTYTPSETDVLIASFIDADLKETAALHSIDHEAILKKYHHQTDNSHEAILLHIGAVQKDLSKHNDKISKKLRQNTRLEPTTPVPYKAESRPLSGHDVSSMSGKQRDNTKIIGYISGANQVLGSGNHKMNAETFVDLLEKHAEGKIDDATVELAKAELAATTKSLERAANAYLLVVGDKENDFKNHDFIEELKLDDDADRNQVISFQQRARQATTQPLVSTPPTGTQPTPGTMPGRRPGTTPNPPATQSGSGTTPPPTGTTPGGTQGQGPGNPPQPGAQPVSRETKKLREAAIQAELFAAQSNYNAALARFAERKVKKIATTADREAFQEASMLLMEKNPETNKILTNTEITEEERAAQINFFYVQRQAELRKAMTANEMAAHEKGASAWVMRHKKGIKIAGYLLAGATMLTGNVGVALAIGGATRGLTKGAEHHDKKAKEFFAADVATDGGAPSHINAELSRLAARAYIERQRNANKPIDPKEVAKAAYVQLMKECDETFVERYDAARQKRALGALGIGTAWFAGSVLIGGEAIDGLDYAWNGSGGFMDTLNHLDNPNGPTPWQPSAEKPWWWSSATPWILTGIGGASAVALAAKNRKK